MNQLIGAGEMGGLGGDGRTAAALPLEAQEAHGGIVMHHPYLVLSSAKAKQAGMKVLLVYQLGPNQLNAEFVTISDQDKAFITGPEVDIVLSDGGFDQNGYWIASTGKGKIAGEAVTLEPTSEGYVFVTDGEDGVALGVRASIAEGGLFHAPVIAERRME